MTEPKEKIMKLISTPFAALLLAAHADLNDKDNHVEGVGGHGLYEATKGK
jgi:hypothetical protein